MPKRIHIIGRKNSGKTTLVTELIHHLTEMGHRIGTIKHTHHHHELDVPGKDSFRHREAGASVVGILAPKISAVYMKAAPTDDKESRYETITPLFEGCDLILVEGDSQTCQPKIEVWRQATAMEPLAATDQTILSVVTNDPIEIDVPVRRRDQVSALASWILDL